MTETEKHSKCCRKNINRRRIGKEICCSAASFSFNFSFDILGSIEIGHVYMHLKTMQLLHLTIISLGSDKGNRDCGNRTVKI